MTLNPFWFLVGIFLGFVIVTVMSKISEWLHRR